MSENCNQQCSDCDVDCTERKPDSFIEAPHELSNIKTVIGVVSGKGGVGKTLVTSMLAVSMQRAGYRAAVLDADVTGPSIPHAFGMKQKAAGNELGLFPVKSNSGIPIMSVNLLLEHDTDPVVWRGPIIAGTVKQFWTDVIWGDVDFMFVDLPPGTGDVPLTVFQSIPLDGIVVVTSPQELVGMIVEKAVNMAGKMNVPVLALIENMSYYQCPDCGKRHNLFGESNMDRVAAKHRIDVVCKMPVDSKLAAAADNGTVEQFENNYLGAIIKLLEERMGKKMKIAVTYADGQVFQHFGHTEHFKVYEVQNGEVQSASILDTNGSGHGALADILRQNSVDALICGGIGAGAKNALAEAGIQLYGGVVGDADKAIADYLANKLTFNSDAECDHHHGEGEHDCHGNCHGHSH